MDAALAMAKQFEQQGAQGKMSGLTPLEARARRLCKSLDSLGQTDRAKELARSLRL